MQNLAMAVAIAIKYIEELGDEGALDQDIKVMEDISSYLVAATTGEQEAVVAALNKLRSPHLVEGLGLIIDCSKVPHR